MDWRISELTAGKTENLMFSRKGARNKKDQPGVFSEISFFWLIKVNYPMDEMPISCIFAAPERELLVDSW